jgi:hypothetical protein
MNNSEKLDLLCADFKKKFKGLSLEEEMKSKWQAMAQESTQKKAALVRQNKYYFTRG